MKGLQEQQGHLGWLCRPLFLYKTGGGMKIWYHGLSSPERWKSYYQHIGDYIRKVADPGTEVEAHGVSAGGVGD